MLLSVYGDVFMLGAHIFSVENSSINTLGRCFPFPLPLDSHLPPLFHLHFLQLQWITPVEFSSGPISEQNLEVLNDVNFLLRFRIVVRL